MQQQIIYDAFMLPFESFAGLSSCRKHLIPHALGKVLEVGPGTGVNARRYNAEGVESITLLGPDESSGEALLRRYGGNGIPVEFIAGDVQNLPFEDGRFDTVVATLLFCSVTDPLTGLKELRRVLKPGGSYLFIEHVRPRSRGFAGLADLATPLWKRIAGGCHLNRDTESAIREAGFTIDHNCDYARGVFVGGIALSR